MMSVRAKIKEEILALHPIDEIEKQSIANTIKWIDSGVEIFRIKKPATPNKHLVSYFVVVDGDHLLLVDHINAEKWLPTGGHVEKKEHPQTTVKREAEEELGIEAELLFSKPLLVTETETVGKTAGHVDVCLWYAIKGSRDTQYNIDLNEFKSYKWFSFDKLPQITDPNLGRFVEKYLLASKANF